MAAARRISAVRSKVILSSFLIISGVLACTQFLRSLLFSPLLPIPVQPHVAKGGSRGAVASESSACSKIGTDAILRGGTAADAIISTALCIGVVALSHGGIGGGGFMLVRSVDGSYEAVDFRECAPAAAFENMYKGNYQASLTGGLASGVPGELRGLEYIHKKHGRLPWGSLFEPSIKLARRGFPVNGDLIIAMREATDPEFLTEDPVWAEVFAPDGQPLALGDLVIRKRYADTLEKIAKGGPSAFYRGDIAKFTIAAVQAKGGTMSLEDLSNYEVKVREPVSIRYRGYKIHSCGAPASGAVVLSALKTVEGFEDMGLESSLNLNTHRLDEAFKFAYGERVHLGDPDFVSGLGSYEEEMLNDTTARNIRQRLSDDHTLPTSGYNPEGLQVLQDVGTAHMIAIDGNGLAITLTSTVNDLFGSHLMVPETGVIMNDQMNDFSVPNMTNEFGYIPSPANFIRPGKRPLSSLAPTIVEHLANSSLYFAVGAAGGSRIITSVAQILWFALDMGMSPRQALARPRWHDQLQPNQVEMEWTFDNDTVAYMKSKGHNVTLVEPGITDVYAIKVGPDRAFQAAAEPSLVDSGVSIV